MSFKAESRGFDVDTFTLELSRVVMVDAHRISISFEGMFRHLIEFNAAGAPSAIARRLSNHQFRVHVRFRMLAGTTPSALSRLTTLSLANFFNASGLIVTSPPEVSVIVLDAPAPPPPSPPPPMGPPSIPPGTPPPSPPPLLPPSVPPPSPPPVPPFNPPQPPSPPKAPPFAPPLWPGFALRTESNSPRLPMWVLGAAVAGVVTVIFCAVCSVTRHARNRLAIPHHDVRDDTIDLLRSWQLEMDDDEALLAELASTSDETNDGKADFEPRLSLVPEGSERDRSSTRGSSNAEDSMRTVNLRELSRSEKRELGRQSTARILCSTVGEADASEASFLGQRLAQPPALTQQRSHRGEHDDGHRTGRGGTAEYPGRNVEQRLRFTPGQMPYAKRLPAPSKGLARGASISGKSAKSNVSSTGGSATARGWLEALLGIPTARDGRISGNSDARGSAASGADDSTSIANITITKEKFASLDAAERKVLLHLALPDNGRLEPMAAVLDRPSVMRELGPVATALDRPSVKRSLSLQPTDINPALSHSRRIHDPSSSIVAARSIPTMHVVANGSPALSPGSPPSGRLGARSLSLQSPAIKSALSGSRRIHDPSSAFGSTSITRSTSGVAHDSPPLSPGSPRSGRLGVHPPICLPSEVGGHDEYSPMHPGSPPTAQGSLILGALNPPLVQRSDSLPPATNQKACEALSARHVTISESTNCTSNESTKRTSKASKASLSPGRSHSETRVVSSSVSPIEQKLKHVWPPSEVHAYNSTHPRPPQVPPLTDESACEAPSAQLVISNESTDRASKASRASISLAGRSHSEPRVISSSASSTKQKPKLVARAQTSRQIPMQVSNITFV